MCGLRALCDGERSYAMASAKPCIFERQELCNGGDMLLMLYIGVNKH